MDATGMRAFATVNIEERLYLFQNAVEGTGLDPRLRFDGVAVHGIAGPRHLRAFATDHADEPRQLLRNSVGAEAADKREAARPVLRIENGDQLQQLVVRQRRTAF